MSSTFGEYQLIEILGRGGAATVYRALGPRRPDRPRAVALKLLHETLRNDEYASMAFQWEGQLGLLLRHPNLVRTYGIESLEGQTALVLEYVEGPTLLALHHQLQQAPWVTSDQYVAATLVAQVCRGLGALHSVHDEDGAPLHCVHRDVSLGNVVVNAEGQAKVIDLGVAYSEGHVLQTAAGTVRGKLAYMAPEYLQGRPWDHRLDVWSAGVVLWEMATGRRLFRRASPSETVAAVFTAAVPDPRALRPGISPMLAAIVRVALDRRPERRYASMEEMANDLDAVVAEASPYDAHAVSAWLGRLAWESQSGVHEVAHDAAPLEGRDDTTRRAFVGGIRHG
ncbi:MAG TPA: serine/threonine-protein kinase [Polyangiaceae bacterium]|nr:serine/threonine-protein kinase [Polyangiaceae bacterium]